MLRKIAKIPEKSTIQTQGIVFPNPKPFCDANAKSDDRRFGAILRTPHHDDPSKPDKWAKPGHVPYRLPWYIVRERFSLYFVRAIS